MNLIKADGSPLLAPPVPVEDDDEIVYRVASSARLTPVKILDHRSVVLFLPFNWERQVSDLRDALEAQQLGAFERVLIAPRVVVTDGKPTGYDCTDVVFIQESWHCAFQLDIATDRFADHAKKLVETAGYRLARYQNRKKVIR